MALRKVPIGPIMAPKRSQWHSENFVLVPSIATHQTDYMLMFLGGNEARYLKKGVIKV